MYSHVDQSPENCHVVAGVHRLVGAYQPLLGVAQWLGAFLLALVADLPGLLLAVLGVAVLLGFLWTILNFKLADFLRLEMTVLLLYREGGDIGELFTIPVNISLASFHLDLNKEQLIHEDIEDTNLTGDVVAALSRLP